MNKKIIIFSAIIILFWGYLFLRKSDSSSVNQSLLSESNNQMIVIDTSSVSKNTEDWKTYTNQSLKFSVRYPSDQVVIEQQSEEGVIFTFPQYANQVQYAPTSLQILRRGAPGEEAVDVLSSEVPILNGQKELPNYELVKLNNSIGVKPLSGFSGVRYYVNDENLTGSPVIISVGSDVNDDVKILEEIVKTFKFFR